MTGTRKIVAYAAAQMALDVVGDFLGECALPLYGNVTAKSYISPLYPRAPHLEDPDQVDAETCSYRISLSHSTNGCPYDYSNFRFEI